MAGYGGSRQGSRGEEEAGGYDDSRGARGEEGGGGQRREGQEEGSYAAAAWGDDQGQLVTRLVTHRGAPVESSHGLRSRRPRPHRHRSRTPRLGFELWRARQRRRAGLRPRRELFLLGQPAPQSVR